MDPPKRVTGSVFQNGNPTAHALGPERTDERVRNPSCKGRTPLAELRESSLLFSLDNLLAHEQARVAEERRALERQREAELEAAARRERERVETAAREAAELRNRQALEERRRVEEEARLEAIRHAEIERVAGGARLGSELEIAAQRREHELRLTATRAVARERVFRSALALTGLVALVALSGAVTLELGVRRPELARLSAENARTLSSERARTDQLQLLLGDSERARRELERRLADPPPAPSAGAVEAAKVPAARPVAPRPSRPPRGNTTARPCRGDPNDPLNPCL